MHNGAFKSRPFSEPKLVIATHNSGKMKEIKDLLSFVDTQLLSAIDLNLPVPIEDGTTFEENALIKASTIAIKTGFPSMSDDSGLCVEALGGDPGVYSADWAGPNRDFGAAINKLQNRMMNTSSSKMGASFVCTLCIAWPDGHYEFAKGEVKGRITFPPRGNNGFGYDPVFIPFKQPSKESNFTYGEMDVEFKNNNSHRSAAFSLLLKKCFPNIL